MEPPRLDLVLDRLRCPVCGGPLTRAERTVRCAHGHTFDLARQGHLTLLGGARPPVQGDTAAMVAARAAFLAAGHYALIAEALAQALAQAVRASAAVADEAPLDVAHAPSTAPDSAPHPEVTPADGPRPETATATPPLVVDLAGGTGYYLAAVLDALPGAVGLDVELSPHAARRAARAHPRLAAVRADIWQPLPLATGSAAAVLSVFGPRNPAEIARVLALEGRLVVVAPAQDHLAEIVGPLGMLAVAPDKDERLARQLADFAVVAERTVRYRATMTHTDVTHEALMGPSAHHVDPRELASAVAALPEPLAVTVAVRVSTYRADT